MSKFIQILVKELAERKAKKDDISIAKATFLCIDWIDLNTSEKNSVSEQIELLIDYTKNASSLLYYYARIKEPAPIKQISTIDNLLDFPVNHYETTKHPVVSIMVNPDTVFVDMDDCPTSKFNHPDFIIWFKAFINS